MKSNRTKLVEAIRRPLGRVLSMILQDETVQKQIWRAANVRPDDPRFHWANYPNDVEEERFKMATRDSAKFVSDHMSDLLPCIDPFELLSKCLNEVKLNGLYLEFGVYSGTTINYISEKVPDLVHGFDSFQGLPEQWGNVPQGGFSTKGHLPSVKDNVRLHVGWFDETLPPFLEENKGPVAFLHIDSDLYSSAKTILTTLADRIVSGTVIVFDEYFNYPGWQDHEHKAFQEYVEQFDVRYKFLGFAKKGYSVGVQIQ